MRWVYILVLMISIFIILWMTLEIISVTDSVVFSLRDYMDRRNSLRSDALREIDRCRKGVGNSLYENWPVWTRYRYEYCRKVLREEFGEE